MTTTMIAQTAIAVFAVASLWIGQRRCSRIRKGATAIGLPLLPVWFYLAWTVHWAVLALCVGYSLAWIRGWHHNWMPGETP